MPSVTQGKRPLRDAQAPVGATEFDDSGEEDVNNDGDDVNLDYDRHTNSMYLSY